MRVLISAGEASGDLYASRLVEALRARHPDAQFFGCAGPRMQAAGVRPIVDTRSLAVVGIVEVAGHLPRIWREFRKLTRAIAAERPDIAILTDAPDFHLRLAKKLRRRGVPVVYLVAPQAWAWREGRVKTMRATIERLLCIFPFEQKFFEDRGIRTTFIGHPLAQIVKPALTREEFCAKTGLDPAARILALLPGSRVGEAARHLPILIEAARILRERHGVTPVLALPAGFGFDSLNLKERIRAASIQVLEGRVMEGLTWEVLAQSELALAASGTVTIEAALLGAPMVTFYRVNELSWMLGRWLVRAPFLTMVNLVAERRIVPELMQQEMTAARIADEASALLADAARRSAMRADLAGVARELRSERDPMENAADAVEEVWRGRNGCGGVGTVV